MFGRSSNATKAMKDVQRIKMYGGTANLSFSQVVCLICNSQDAKAYLSVDEFEYFSAVFKLFREKTKCLTVDINGYLKMCDVIIKTFEEKFPFLLVDGEHSESLELHNQLKIRKLYADGLSFKDALYEYENNFEKISLDGFNFDPYKDPFSQKIANYEIAFSQGFFIEDFFASLSQDGFLLGIADAVYWVLASRLGLFTPEGANNITMYIAFFFAKIGFSNKDSRTMLLRRKEISPIYYNKLSGLPVSQIKEIVVDDVLKEFGFVGTANKQHASDEMQKNITHYIDWIQETLTKEIGESRK